MSKDNNYPSWFLFIAPFPRWKKNKHFDVYVKHKCRCCGHSHREQHQDGRHQARRIVLLGKPCSGKGTQAPLLSSRYGFIHLSTGQMLRQELSENTALGILAAEYMKQGDMLPDDMMLPLVAKRISQPDCQKHGYILDGFPRTLSQAVQMSRYSIGVDLVFLLQRSDEDAQDWMRHRLYDPSTGVLYHPVYFPPPAHRIPYLQRRMDDQEAVMQKRLQQYRQNTLPLVHFFQDKLVWIDTSNKRPTEQVFEEICQHVERWNAGVWMKQQRKDIVSRPSF